MTQTSKKLIINANDDEVEKKYRFGRTLGQGTFATVRMVTSVADGSKWAVKIIKRSALTSEDEESLRTEIQILQLTNHANIVSVREVFYCKNYVYLVMELMTGGELFDRVVTKDHYSEQEAKQALAQIVTAIKYCHDQNIVHRDLKPENILYQGPEDSSPLKLADFGLAALLKPNQLMTVACGTPGYVAPEILRGIAYGKEVDIWSIGVILYILLCGFPPFYDDNNKKLFAQIVSANYSFPDPYWTNISTSAKNLVTQLLVINPHNRLTAEEILQHPWMAEDGTALPLDHFKPNLKSYNARRRFRSAIRAVQITQLLRNLTKNNATLKSPIDALGSSAENAVNGGSGSGSGESERERESDANKTRQEDSALSLAQGETSSESESDGSFAASAAAPAQHTTPTHTQTHTQPQQHTVKLEKLEKLEKIPESAEGIEEHPTAIETSVSALATTNSPAKTDPATASARPHTSSHATHSPQHTNTHSVHGKTHHKTPTSAARKMSK